MAQFCNCARIVLAHALLLIFGKASIRFFEVVDSGSCLDSEKLDSRFCFCESWLDSVGLLSLTTKRSFFRKLVIAVWLCKLCGFLEGWQTNRACLPKNPQPYRIASLRSRFPTIFLPTKPNFFGYTPNEPTGIQNYAKITPQSTPKQTHTFKESRGEATAVF